MEKAGIFILIFSPNLFFLKLLEKVNSPHLQQDLLYIHRILNYHCLPFYKVYYIFMFMRNNYVYNDNMKTQKSEIGKLGEDILVNSC